jgi:hypothetical protein
MSQKDQVEFRALLDRALVDVIDTEFLSAAEFSDLCQQFVSWLLQTATGIVTTNYDLEIDMALKARLDPDFMRKQVDYGFAWREVNDEYQLVPRPQDPLFRLYKLHGSLNWLTCQVCEHTYINLDESIKDRAFDEQKGNYNTCHCGHFPLSPVIISPSFVRDVRNADLLYLWKNALEHLRLSPKWVIIGYSLPGEDLAIRSLLMRAYNAREGSHPPDVLVVLRTECEATRSRYLSIFPNAEFEWSGVDGFLKKIGAE